MNLHRKRMATAIALILACSLLAACGGGSGGGLARSPPPPAPQPSAPPPPPATPLGPCPMPVTGNCVVTTYGTMLGGRDSANAFRVQLPLGQDLRLGSSDPTVGSQDVSQASYRFAGGTVVEHGGLMITFGNSLQSNIQVQRDGYLGIGGSAVGLLDNEGITEIFGTLTGTVANRGKLYLLGTIHGDVHNEGFFDADAAAWNGVSASITGNYADSPSSTLVVALCPKGWDCQSGLTVSGRADIAGTLQLRQYTDAWGPYDPPGTGAHRILHANGGVFGTFARWTSPGLFIEGNLRYRAYDVWFDLTRVSLQAAMAGQGFGGITLASAANLDRALAIADGFAPAPNPTQSRFLRSAASLLWLDDAQLAARSLDSLAGAEHAGFATGAQKRASRTAGELALHAGGRRMDGLSSRWSMQRVGGRIDGHDQWLGPRTLLGGSIATDSSVNGTASHVDRRASLYLHQRGEHWQSTLVATAGRSNALLQRRIDLADRQAHVAGTRRRVDLVQLHAELARPLPLAGGHLLPYAAVDAGVVRGGGFLEQGDTGFELTSNGGVSQQFGAALGLRYLRDWRVGPQRVRLLAELQQARRLRVDGQWQAAFLGVPDAVFDLRDWREPRSTSAQLSLQGNTLHGWQWALSGVRDHQRAIPMSWQLRLAHDF